LDRVTHSVRAFYEAYPYPPGDRVDCDGYQVRLLLSYLERTSESGAPLQVLEAGCGRGLNLLAAAAAQPGIRFRGIDISRVAIEEAGQAVVSQGLQNLEFQVADLMQPRTLPEVPGGYDLILSYGVLHHLNDPEAGLHALRCLLSPRGAIAFMVDGRFGRQSLDRFLQALAILDETGDSRQPREVRARALARVAEKGLFKSTHWQGTVEADAVEFADRCLHVQEQSYTIDELWALMSSAGLTFLRWLEPLDWQISSLPTEPSLAAEMASLDTLDRYRLIERLCERPKLTLIVVPEGGRPRSPLTISGVDEAVFRLNPQLKAIQRNGRLLWQLRNQPPTAAHGRLAENVLNAAQALDRDFTAESLTQHLKQQGLNSSHVRECLFRLEAAEWLYRPHMCIEGEDA
jgi:SAM-dependent methyltransferase